MSDVFEGYERQYCELSANLSRKRNSTSLLPDGEEKKGKIAEIKSGLDDCDVLVRTMDLEASSLQPNVKAMLLAKLREYKADLNTLKREFKRISSDDVNQAACEELLEAGLADVHAVSADQRERLSMSVERLNQSGDRIKESRRTIMEAEKDKKRKKDLEKETAQIEEAEEKRTDEECLVEDEQKGMGLASNDDEEDMLDHGVSPDSNNEEATLSLKNELKEHLLNEAAKGKKSGVCYLSRISPNMDHVKLRHILSKLGEIKRIYLAPKRPVSHANRPYKKGGRSKPREFSEGWVEFANRSVAKRVANMLNGEQIGGRKRSQFYYDLWNIKYLSKFKWDDLTEEIAYKNAVREQKLALEIAAAKRERDFYLKKVDQHLALNAIEDRLKKKQKVRDAPKVIRQFPQRKPVVDESEKNKPKLSTDVLAGVFGGS